MLKRYMVRKRFGTPDLHECEPASVFRKRTTERENNDALSEIPAGERSAAMMTTIHRKKNTNISR